MRERWWRRGEGDGDFDKFYFDYLNCYPDQKLPFNSKAHKSTSLENLFYEFPCSLFPRVLKNCMLISLGLLHLDLNSLVISARQNLETMITLPILSLNDYFVCWGRIICAYKLQRCHVGFPETCWVVFISALRSSFFPPSEGVPPGSTVWTTFSITITLFSSIPFTLSTSFPFVLYSFSSPSQNGRKQQGHKIPNWIRPKPSQH